ncbi:hypothetical protein RHOSPDRAFT_26605 [Rhodotorula sp. JG-1b]|nr:hypothetical protein RHOSPDRAFT_26605 [Rhodotorula sp. JG-1b]
MQTHPEPEPPTEHGLDGWHVWAPGENLLFYSKHPVVKVPINAGGQNAREGLEVQDEEINIENISQYSWTDLMKSAHQELLEFGMKQYVKTLESSQQELVRKTLGKNRAHLADLPQNWPSVAQFAAGPHATSHCFRQFGIRLAVLNGEKKESMFSLVRVARDARESLKTQYNLSKNGWQAHVFWHIVSSNLFHGVRGKQTGMMSRQEGQFKPFQAAGRNGAFSWSNSHLGVKAWCGICRGLKVVNHARNPQSRSIGREY